MIVTLTSDFGYQDNFVGVAKAILLQHYSDANYIDISHDVTPHHLLECHYLLSGACSFFPKGTVHLSLFDTMPAIPSAIVVMEWQEQIFISANNGLLPLIAEGDESVVYHTSLHTANNYMQWLHLAATLIGDLAEEKTTLQDLPTIVPNSYNLPQLLVDKNGVLDCRVVHVDRYGNVVLNLTRKQFEAYANNREFRISWLKGEYISAISTNYSDVAEGEKLCRFNSADYLEIAVNKDNASRLLGLRLSPNESLVYKTIKIEFL